MIIYKAQIHPGEIVKFNDYRLTLGVTALAIVIITGCPSNKQNARSITTEVANKLTENVSFDNGTLIALPKPPENTASELKLLSVIMPDNIEFGRKIEIDLYTDYEGSDVAGAVMYIPPANVGYMQIAGKLEPAMEGMAAGSGSLGADGKYVMHLLAVIKGDSSYGGKIPKLEFALYKDVDGGIAVGNYVNHEVKLPDATDGGTIEDAGVDAGSNGVACTDAGECSSGLCINKRCCKDDCAITKDPAKDINCWRCDVNGHEGECSDAVPGTICNNPICVSKDVKQLAWECGANDTAGLCMDKGLLECDPFACDSSMGACYQSPCSGHAQCADGFACCPDTCIDISRQDNNCAGATNLGENCGDSQCDLMCMAGAGYFLMTDVSGRTSGWYRARATVCDTKCVNKYIRHKISLTVPAGVAYEMCVYTDNCTNQPACMTATGETYEFIVQKFAEAFDYFIEIKWISGASCDDWMLSIYYEKC